MENSSTWELDNEVARRLLRDEDTPATVLHTILAKAYGLDVLYGSEEEDPIDPVVLWNEIEDDFRISFPEDNENKLNALMLAVSTDGFFRLPEIFASTCISLATGDLGDFVNGEFDSPTVYEILIAINEIDIVDGDREALFSSDIKQLVQAITKREGVDLEQADDVYEQDVTDYMEAIQASLIAIGVPSNLAEFPSESDYYGLLD